MTSRSSIFSFETLKLGQNPVRKLGLSLAVVAGVLAAGEVAARLAVSRGWLEEEKSLRLLVEDRIQSIDSDKPTIWMLGNSTLDWGIDQKQFETGTDEKIVKLSHGSATVKGSAEMLAYYFRHTTARPREVIFTTTKDDFNANGSRNDNSKRYHEIDESDRLPNTDPSTLRNVRTDLRNKALPWVFVEKAEKVADFDGKPIELTHEFNNGLVKDFSPQYEWLKEMKRVCTEAGVKKLTVILLPVTDRNVQFHDAKVTAPKYDAFRKQLHSTCETNGINLIDWGTPRTDYKRFRDSYHLNPAGMKWQTQRLIDFRKAAATRPAIQAITEPTTRP